MSTTLIAPQRMAALTQANGIRTAQAEWKADMAGRSQREALEEAARILLEAPAKVGGLSIHAFLTSIPTIGDTKAQRILTNRQEGWYIWPFRKVRDLTVRQRARLAEELNLMAHPPIVLTVIEEAILGVLSFGPCYASDIAEGIGALPSSMGARVYGLCRRGLIESDVQGHRRRWRLTDAGRVVALQMRSSITKAA